MLVVNGKEIKAIIEQKSSGQVDYSCSVFFFLLASKFNSKGQFVVWAAQVESNFKLADTRRHLEDKVK